MLHCTDASIGFLAIVIVQHVKHDLLREKGPLKIFKLILSRLWIGLCVFIVSSFGRDVSIAYYVVHV